MTADRPVLQVRNHRIERLAGGTNVSADVGDMNVWFRVPPGCDVSASGDAFLATALIPAMALGADLDLTALPPVSPTLLAATPLIQEIWTSWNALLRRVDVRVSGTSANAAVFRGTAAFFSGGIDAAHTALERRSDLDRLVLVNGFDFRMTPAEFDQALARVRHQAEYLELPVIGVETNWYDFTCHHRIARATTYGSALCAIAHVLAPDRMLIASSNSYARLTPIGSHPMLDPLWSSDATQVEHHGSHARRGEKVAAVAEHPAFLRETWVCHEEPVRNCGVCSKCRRLRAMLWLLGKEELVFGGASRDPMGEWLRTIRGGGEALFLNDMAAMARDCGQTVIARRIDRYVAMIAAIRNLRLLDHTILGGAISRFRRRNDESPDLFPWGSGPTLDA